MPESLQTANTQVIYLTTENVSFLFSHFERLSIHNLVLSASLALDKT